MNVLARPAAPATTCPFVLADSLWSSVSLAKCLQEVQTEISGIKAEAEASDDQEEFMNEVIESEARLQVSSDSKQCPTCSGVLWVPTNDVAGLIVTVLPANLAVACVVFVRVSNHS